MEFVQSAEIPLVRSVGEDWLILYKPANQNMLWYLCGMKAILYNLKLSHIGLGNTCHLFDLTKVLQCTFAYFQPQHLFVSDTNHYATTAPILYFHNYLFLRDLVVWMHVRNKYSMTLLCSLLQLGSNWNLFPFPEWQELDYAENFLRQVLWCFGSVFFEEVNTSRKK